MNLGEILAAQDNGKALVGKRVEFQVIKRKLGALPLRFSVQAILYPVGEAERQQSKRDAVKYLRTLPDYQKEEDGTLPVIPSDVLAEERQYKFLAMALHNVDAEESKFVPNKDYADFRSGVVVDQVNWLGRVYDKYIEDEYPEVVSDRDRQDLEDEAGGK